MKITKIIVDNFKSIGESKNKLRLEKGTTVLIGKNGSGKSNVLDAIYAMKFTSPLKVPDNSKNRINNRDVSYLIEMVVLPEEAKEFGLREGALTTLEITSQGVSYTGELSKVFSENTEISSISTRLSELLSQHKNKPQTNILYNGIKKLSTNIFINDILKAKNNCISEIAQLKGDQQLLSDIRSMTDELNIKIAKIYSLFPILHQYKEIGLLDAYPYDQISTLWTKNKPLNESLDIFLRAAKVDVSLIQKAIEHRHPGEKGKARDRVQALIDENINKRFNEFYGQNMVNVKIVFNESRAINITVESECGLEDNNPQLNLSEESNGLKWYLDFFIDILSHNLDDKPVLFLIDEPGVSLHVDAQCALLGFFDNLTRNKCSLIYSTHSPLMLNSKYPTNMRVIQKINGFTEIINKYYSNEVDGSTKRETLSPFLKGIGARLSNTIFPLFDKPCLITEGITDKLYIESMLKATNYEKNEFYIVPSIGVSNINLLVSIFIGWGLEYKILLDYDKAGFEEYKRLTKDLAIIPCNSIYFVNLQEYKEGVKKEDYKVIETLVEEEDMQKLESWSKSQNDKISKTIVANDFYNKVINNEIELSKKTQSNFSRLFNAIFPTNDNEK